MVTRPGVLPQNPGYPAARAARGSEHWPLAISAGVARVERVQHGAEMRSTERQTMAARRVPIDRATIQQATPRPRIAVFSGPSATIQNTPPLITSNKARETYGLPLRTNPDGSPARFDVLRLQRLAAPVTVYVEQSSAHPLEHDAA